MYVCIYEAGKDKKAPLAVGLLVDRFDLAVFDSDYGAYNAAVVDVYQASFDLLHGGLGWRMQDVAS